MSEQQKDQELEIVDEAIQKLIEHFDYIHIFAGRYDSSDGTTTINKGAGDWHARLGKIRDWVIYQDELTREQAREDYHAEDEE